MLLPQPVDSATASLRAKQREQVPTLHPALRDRRAECYLRRASVLSRVKILTGDALHLLEATDGQFDLIFNDVSKTQYPEVLRLAVHRRRLGGLFISANVLRHGRAARPAARGDAATCVIQEFNRLLCSSCQLFTTIIPLRDGLAVCLKVGGYPG